MKYSITKTGVEVTGISSFSLRDTLNCGQCFRWDEQDDGSFLGVVKGKVIRAFMKGDDLVLDGTTEHDFENLWREYFDLDLDYYKIFIELTNKVTKLKQAGEYAQGVRILRQEPWETLCSFIISQNNNIPRIKGIIYRLCKQFGTHIYDDFYSFPKPQALENLTIEDLAPLRSGFRAGYILDAAKKVGSGEINLEKIKTLPLDEARLELMKIRGVGPKVAECELLYGMHKLEAFPMDVWMKRAMAALFPKLGPKDFGGYAGIAQQYIFHYSRMNSEIFKED